MADRECRPTPNMTDQELVTFLERNGGFHPLARFETGYPPRLSYGVLRNSNAMVALASQLAAVVTGDPQAMIPVRSLHTEFADCLPVISQ